LKKIRVIVNDVCFYTSRKAIKERRVGSYTLQNDALCYALERMGTNDGIGTTVRYYDHKMEQKIFQIQLSVV
jgi:hypothetical protein